MKPEDFNARTQEIIANLSDQAKVTTLLTELIEDNNKMNVDTATALQKAEQLTADNEKLRQANMNLFLKVGETKKEEPQHKQEDNTLKFENLFDEKGNLK